jgi:predicted Zn-dependent protease
LQLAQDSQARAVVDDLMATKLGEHSSFGAYFARAASPARYAVERGDWKEAAGLEVLPTQFPHVEAITHFARALGAARSGKPEAAKAGIDRLAELRDKLLGRKDAYWAGQVDIQWQVANAWMLDAQGKADEALKLMGSAADAEDKTEKAPVTPGSLAPARELYGQMLLEHGKSAEALAAFEATKAKEPNRFRGYAGAAMAAEKLGDKAEAKANYEKLIALVGTAGSDRPEIAMARKYLAQN